MVSGTGTLALGPGWSLEGKSQFARHAMSGLPYRDIYRSSTGPGLAKDRCSCCVPRQFTTRGRQRSKCTWLRALTSHSATTRSGGLEDVG